MKKVLLSAMLICFAIISTGAQSLNNKKLKKMETQNIINTLTAIFNGTDERNWQKVENSFSNKVLLDYSSMSGLKPMSLSPQEITNQWKALMPGFQSTHHQTGNYKVEVNDLSATVKNNGLALHYLPNESRNDTWVVSGTYDFSLVKDAGGKWKVNKMKFNLEKQEGNLELPAMAQRKVKEQVTYNSPTITTSNKAIVEKFFESLEKMDINSFMTVWGDNASQVMPLAPGNFPKILAGKDAIYNQYKTLPENFTSMKYPRKLFATDDPDIVIAQFNGIIPLKDGGEYNNIYLGVFKIKNAKLQEYTEYFDPSILQQFIEKQSAGSSTSNANVISLKKVAFKSEGLVLTGTLHLPASFNEEKIYKAVIVTGSWTTVKEQMPDLYADKIAGLGYVALTFDFRNYGESEGQPRNYEVPKMKAEDIKHAADYLNALPFVDKNNIGGLAICASSGYLAEALVMGAHIKAVTLVAPWLHNRTLVESMYGGKEGVEKKIAAGKAAKNKFAETGIVDYTPGISTTDSNAAMFGNLDYYLDPKRGAIKEWGNQFAVMAWQGWLEYDPIPFADKINIPVRIIHSKEAAVPDGAEQFYNRLKAIKEITWIDKATQLDFYDQEPYTTNAAKDAAEWFNVHLK